MEVAEKRINQGLSASKRKKVWARYQHYKAERSLVRQPLGANRKLPTVVKRIPISRRYYKKGYISSGNSSGSRSDLETRKGAMYRGRKKRAIKESFSDVIIRVGLDNSRERVLEVPITPQTTCADVVACCREAGENPKDCYLAELWRGCERPVSGDEKLYEILHQWGVHRDEVFFFLRHDEPKSSSSSGQLSSRKGRNGMKEINHDNMAMLPSGADLTLGELQTMASRQQQQIQTQQQLLVAKEQRLRFLRQQEKRHQQMASETERVRQLREKVESQEARLNKLRAIKGQVTTNLTDNTSLSSELESIKQLFKEKEKELSMAVVKVEELTRQLDELRRESDDTGTHNTASDITKLKQELQIRNKLNEEQNSQLVASRKILSERQHEMSVMDQRIADLQARVRQRKQQQENNDNKIMANIAAVEPYVKNSEGVDALSKSDPKYQTLPHGIKLPSDELKQHNDSGVTKLSNNNENVALNSGSSSASSSKIVTISSATNVPASSTQSKSSTSRMMNSFAPRPYGVSYSNKSRSISSVMSVSNSASPVNATAGNSTVTSQPLTSTPVTRVATSSASQPVSSVKPSVSTEREQFMKGRHPLNSASSVTSSVNVPSPSSSSPVTTQPLNVQINPTPSSQLSPRQRPAQPPSYQQATSRRMLQQAENHSPSLSPSNHSSQRPSPSSPQSPGYNSPPATTYPLQQPQTSAASNSQQSDSKGYTNSNPPSDQQYQHQNKSDHTYQETSTSFAADSIGDSSPVNTSPPAVSSALSVLMGTNATTTTTSSQTKSYRYATKSVIANTYMRKLGSNAMEQYRKNMSAIYGGNEGKEDATRAYGPGPMATVHPMNVGRPNNEQQTPNSYEFSGPPSPTRQVNGPVSYNDWVGDNMHPQYNIDPERARLGALANRPNAPRPLRRRLSSGELPQPDLSHMRPHSNYRPSYAGTPRPKDIPENNSPTAFEKEPNNNTPKSLQGQPDIIPFNNNDIHKNSYNSTKDSDIPLSNHALPQQNYHIPTKSQNILPYSETESAPREGEPQSPKRFNLPQIIKKKTNLKSKNSVKNLNRVSFDPHAILLDASLEGELDLVKKSASEVEDPSRPNDEGITALHNAICAGHFEIVKFLVEFGCDVNAPDSDGWTPLHCAASCNNLPMVRLLVEHGACIFATTISDQETAAEKCEEDEDGYDGCSEYLYSIQEKLGILNKGTVYAVFDYDAVNADELSFNMGDKLVVMKKGDDEEKEWWWSRKDRHEGYIPRNLLGLCPRVQQK